MGQKPSSLDKKDSGPASHASDSGSVKHSREDEIRSLREEVSLLKQQIREQCDRLSKVRRDNRRMQLSLDSRASISRRSESKTEAKKCDGSGECSDVSELIWDAPISKVEKNFRSQQLIKDALLGNTTRRDQEITDLRSRLDKYQAIFAFSGGPPALLTSPLLPRAIIAGSKKRTRFGISAEPAPGDSTSAGKDLLPVKTFLKDESTTSLLTAAIQANEFMRHYDSGQIAALTACMYPAPFPAGALVIREGDAGNVLYIIESGALEVFNETVSGHRLGRGALFGELALLYNCTRTASVRVLSKEQLEAEGCDGSAGAHLWALERTAFQTVMIERGLRKRSQVLNFLKSVKLFSSLSEDSLSKVVDVSVEREYMPGDYIVREGARGDTFFVIFSGGVRVTKNEEQSETFLRTLGKGDFFGEKALTASSPSPSCAVTAAERGAALRTANVIAEETADVRGVTCLVIDRDAFHELISNKVQEFGHHVAERGQIDDKQVSPFDGISLDDIKKIATLGIGGFGRVELVTFRNKKIPGFDAKSFALKVMKKKEIVETCQQTHILSEKHIMAECTSQFIVRLYATFKDSLNLYMLMEVCLGGELWTMLRDKGRFDENMTRFYAGCACLALEYLHSKNVIFRDLKPENMLLDEHGYAKLTDFGFAKKLLPAGRKTWTFCGTPEYVAPEIILNKGHDYAVDYWSMGVLMFELLTGSPPFSASDPMRTYNIILKGIEAIEFPRFISKDASILIKRLCKETPSERLGYMRGGISEIKSNRWFDGFHWEGLEKRSIPAPYLPTIRSPTDVANFDTHPPEDPDCGTPDVSFDAF